MAPSNRVLIDEIWINNRAQVDALLDRTSRQDNGAWLAEIEDHRRAEESINWEAQDPKPNERD